MGISNTKLVSWAAEEGRVEELIYYLGKAGPSGLKPASDSERLRTPLHLAAISGRLECISILFDAGKCSNYCMYVMWL